MQDSVLRLRPKGGLWAKFGPQQTFLLALQQVFKKVIWSFLFGLFKCNLAISEVCFDFLGYINHHFPDRRKHFVFFVLRLPMTTGVLGLAST